MTVHAFVVLSTQPPSRFSDEAPSSLPVHAVPQCQISPRRSPPPQLAPTSGRADTEPSPWSTTRPPCSHAATAQPRCKRGSRCCRRLLAGPNCIAALTHGDSCAALGSTAAPNTCRAAGQDIKPASSPTTYDVKLTPFALLLDITEDQRQATLPSRRQRDRRCRRGCQQGEGPNAMGCRPFLDQDPHHRPEAQTAAPHHWFTPRRREARAVPRRLTCLRHQTSALASTVSRPRPKAHGAVP